MLALFYNISIYFYQFTIWLVSPFNKKAKLWIDGRDSDFRNSMFDIRNNIRNDAQFQTSKTEHQSGTPPASKLAWFHCASLGEFEQGRPVIEKFRETFPDYKILLTFFSPSGYEVRKNYAGADYIHYLPSDTPKNAKEFIEHFNPSIAFFVKYEFWYNYLRILHEKQIPVISFSAIFRENQIFFKWYGGFQRNILKYFTHIFIQNKSSFELLQSVGIQNVTVGGDTRFDRVKQIADARKNLPIIETFKDGKPLLIIGSCWQEDFEVIAPFLNTFEKDLKVIIAPHEIHEEEIERWRKKLTKKSVRYSDYGIEELKKEEIADVLNPIIPQPHNPQILIIDNIGMLSSLYQYADFAWIGGAYGKGLHNILEAATFGMPIFFGNKNYQKFQEATDLQEFIGAIAIIDTQQFAKMFEQFYDNKDLRQHISKMVENYVKRNTGGTEKVIEFVKNL